MPVEYPCCGSHFWINIAIIFFLVIFAGIMSGLTLGLMSMSNVDLEVLEKSGTPEDRKHAKKLLSVVKKQHLLLCTLLICNAAAMEALPIFLNSLVVPWVAILISVTLILLFGEIVPQSICSRYGLLIGAAAAPYVRLLIWICFPVAYPISKVLDYTLGESRHVALFRRPELKTLVDFHGNEAGKGGELTHDETTIIGGALGLTGKTASDAMTPIGKTFAIDVDAKLDRDMMKLILEKGHSRIPVYYEKPTNIIGLVLVKNLLMVHSEDEVTVRNVTTRRIPRVPDCLPLYDILNEFQKGHSHMAAVTRHRDHGCLLSNGEMKIDIEGAQEKRLKLLQKWKSFSNMNSPKGGSSASKKGAREMDANVLQIGGRPLEKINEEEEVVGIITMEDVIEELLQEEIFDETDHHYHNSRSAGKVNITVQ